MLFGVEAYYINDVDDRVVVHGQTDALFSDEIVCFDIETTGLNKKYEVIIEIGAVVLKNGEVTDRFNTFVSPGRILSPEIIHLTGITDEMLEGAPPRRRRWRLFWPSPGTGLWRPTTPTLIWALSPRAAGSMEFHFIIPRWTA